MYTNNCKIPYIKLDQGDGWFYGAPLAYVISSDSEDESNEDEEMMAEELIADDMVAEDILNEYTWNDIVVNADLGDTPDNALELLHRETLLSLEDPKRGAVYTDIAKRSLVLSWDDNCDESIIDLTDESTILDETIVDLTDDNCDYDDDDLEIVPETPTTSNDGNDFEADLQLGGQAIINDACLILPYSSSSDDLEVRTFDDPLDDILQEIGIDLCSVGPASEHPWESILNESFDLVSEMDGEASDFSIDLIN